MKETAEDEEKCSSLHSRSKWRKICAAVTSRMSLI